MISKNAATTLFLAAFLFAAPVSAQENDTGGSFYLDCGPTRGPAITMVLDNHLRITVESSGLVADEAYRTDTQVFEGELPSMSVNLCDAKMEHCKSIEGVLTAYKDDGDTIEANLEYFDGTEVQGDSESLEGHMARFTVQRDKSKPVPVCK